MHELIASLCCWEGATVDIDSAEKLHENITPVITGTPKKTFLTWMKVYCSTLPKQRGFLL
jgi:hypothetical protein